jgi:hypothetical protein
LNARPGRLELQQPQLRGRLPINSPSARARLARRDPIQQLRRRGPETNKHAPRQGFHRWSRGRRQQQLSRDQRRDVRWYSTTTTGARGPPPARESWSRIVLCPGPPGLLASPSGSAAESAQSKTLAAESETVNFSAPELFLFVTGSVLQLQTWRYSFYSFVHPCLTCWVGHRRGIYARGCRWGSRFG